MPMVPMFQGGMPREVSSGNAGQGVVNAPRPTMDYSRVLQRALEPLDQVANTVSKALEIEANRNIKAESDEAETRFMDAVNERLYNPDSGYFNNQGKNAVDQYDATMQGLKKDADDIMGSLSPWAQDAVRSRIGERLRNAQLKTTQWSNSQRNAWHIGSSKARIDKLVESAGQNYGDADYLGSTLASIDQEVDYLANLQGFGSEQRTALKQGYYDMAVAQRYSSWASDDPVGAMADFQTNRDSLSNDVRERISGDLWRQSKPELAAMVADMIGPTMLDKRDFVREMMAGKQFGVPVIDNLTRSQKIELYSSAYAYAAQKRSGNQADLRRAEKNSLALAATEGFDPNPLSKELFVAAYGEKEGALRFDDYSDNLRTREEVYKYGGLTNDEIAASVESLRPFRGSDNYATEAKNHELAQKAARTVLKARREDPIAAAMMDPKYGISEITDWSQERVFKDLMDRVPLAQQIEERWKTEPSLLTKDELDDLSRHFDLLDASGQSDFAAQLYRALKVPVSDEEGVTVDDSGIGTLVSQLSGNKASKKLATALMLMSDSAPAFGKAYLLGKQLLAEGNAQVNEKYGGDIAWFNEKIGTNAESAGVFDETVDADLARDAFMGVFAFQQQDGGTREETLESVFGNIIDYNGKKIILPRRKTNNKAYSGDAFWWFTRDFNDLMDASVKRIGKEKGYVVFEGYRQNMETFARLIKNRQLQTVGNGRYLVKSQDQSGYARNVDGSYFVLDVLAR